MNEKRKSTQFLKVLKRLIHSNMTGIDGYSMGMTSARNYVSELERHHLTGKLKRITEKTADGTGHYYRYEIADAEQLRQVIAIYKFKGGELSELEEKQAYARF